MIYCSRCGGGGSRGCDFGGLDIGVRAVCVGHIFKLCFNGTTVERHYLSPKLFIGTVLALYDAAFVLLVLDLRG